MMATFNWTPSIYHTYGFVFVSDNLNVRLQMLEHAENFLE